MGARPLGVLLAFALPPATSGRHRARLRARSRARGAARGHDARRRQRDARARDLADAHGARRGAARAARCGATGAAPVTACSSRACSAGRARARPRPGARAPARRASRPAGASPACAASARASTSRTASPPTSRQLARASGVAARLEPARLPLPPGFAAACARAGRDPLRLALAGGEDYELLFSVRPAGPGAGELARRLGVRVTEIGRLERGRPALRGISFARPRLAPLLGPSSSYARSARCAPGGTGLAVWLRGLAPRSARCGARRDARKRQAARLARRYAARARLPFVQAHPGLARRVCGGAGRPPPDRALGPGGGALVHALPGARGRLRPRRRDLARDRRQLPPAARHDRAHRPRRPLARRLAPGAAALPGRDHGDRAPHRQPARRAARPGRPHAPARGPPVAHQRRPRARRGGRQRGGARHLDHARRGGALERAAAGARSATPSAW